MGSLDTNQSNSTENVALPYDVLSASRDTANVGRTTHIIDGHEVSLLSNSRKMPKNDKTAVLVAVTASLLYRYSNQNQLVFPCSINLGQRQNISVECSFEQEQTLYKLIDTIKHQINSQRRVKSATNFHLFISDAAQESQQEWERLLDSTLLNSELNFFIRISNAKITLHVQFDQSIFIEKTIVNLAQHWHNLVENACGDEKIHDLEILSSVEKAWLDQQGKGADADDSLFSIPHIFEHLAKSQPKATAAKFNEHSLTYQQLNQQANQLSHCLAKKGITEGSRVIVFLEPGFDILVGLLAIFKQGATYVPLDPGFPDARIRAIIEDVEPSVIYTTRTLSTRLDRIDTEQILTDSSKDHLATFSSDNPSHPVSSDSTATIFYTSGTTGKPKGVMASYSNINHYLAVAQRKYDYNSNDIIPAVARFTFSISLFELLSPLLAGGTAIILERSHILDLDRMLTTLQKVTAAHIGPSLLKAIIAHIKEQNEIAFPQLRHISSGGDMVPPEVLQDLQQLFKYAEIYVIYGCSEISCMGVTHFIEHSDTVHKTYVGRPFENVRVTIFDDNFKPLPAGAIGNVCFAGKGVVKGYLGQPELTAEKFFLIDNIRYYNTGDRGRLSHDGKLELLGRLDFQIQLRGIRIELGEIEYTLRKSPNVRDGVIAQKKNRSNENLLVAYLIAEHDHRINLEDVRGYLKQQLPDYMLPTHYVVLEKLPLNHNLKVDRSALPDPFSSVNATNFEDKNYLAPVDELQKSISAIWQRLLQQDRISRERNFFEMGGDSLTLAQAITLLRTEHQVNIKLTELFESATIESWAKSVAHAKTIALESSETQDSSEVFAINPESKPLFEDAYQRKAFPVSYPQSQFWFLFQLNTESSANNIPQLYLIENLQIIYFQQAIQLLFERHATFRTNFNEIDDELIQLVRPAFRLDIPVHQCGSKAIDEPQVRQQIEQAALRPFDMENGSKLRVEIFEFEHNKAIVLICFHHIAVDQTAIVRFGEELEQLYTQLLDGTSIKLKEISLEYSDYAVWQNQWQSQDRLETQINFWQQQLTGVSHYLDFPLDFPRTHSDNAHDLSFEFSPQLSQQMEQFSRTHGITVYNLLLAGYALTLHRYTQQKDIIVGTPFANRIQQYELQDVLGCFINTLPIVTHFSDEQLTVSQLLQQVQKTLFGASENQIVPTEKIISAVNPERYTNVNPLYQVGLTYQDAPLELSLKNATIEPIPLKSGAIELDFFSRLWHDSEKIQGVITYKKSILTYQSVSNFVEHFKMVLTETIRSPEQKVSRLPIFNQSQLTLQKSHNNTNFDFSPPKHILESFEKQVTLTPDAIALEYMQMTLSYQQLDRKADQLAYYLIQSGVIENQVIGVLFHRSLEMLIAIYGILKAGAAYVPIDPEHPEERLSFILQEANITTLLTHSKAGERSIDNKQINLLNLDENWNEVENAPKIKRPTNTSESSAYSIYTSGSTGRPKGVVVSHNAVINSFCWMQQNFKLSKEDVLLLKTPYTFDVSIWEIFWPLMHGAKLVIAEADGHKDTAYLKQIIEDKQVSFLNFVPSMMHVFLQEEDLKNCKSLKYILSGGESLTLEQAQLVFERTHAELYNGYGPTEAAICVSLWHCQRQTTLTQIPIGCPTANNYFYLLDEQRQSVPEGATGELYIGGAQIAQGYLNQPELTQAVFIDDPFTQDSSAKMYKTGDKAKRLPDGALVYQGRTDSQIKLRGLRIEPGEIENAIVDNNITQAIVTCYQSKKFGQQLVAYYTAADGMISEETLSKRVLSKLPAYMLPSCFIYLEEFPLSSSGKIDYKNLPSPDLSDLYPGKTQVEPRNNTELKISQLWQKLLKTQALSIHDKFFDVGGHSLLATMLRSRMTKELGVNIPLKLLLDKNTIALQAEYVQQSDGRESEPLPASLATYISESEYQPDEELSFAQQRLWYLDQLDPGNPVYNIPLAYCFKGKLDTKLLQQCLQTIVSRHESLRTSFMNVEGREIQSIKPDISVNLAFEDISTFEDNQLQLQQRLSSLSNHSFDLNKGPLFLFALFKLGDQEHVMFVLAHHTIFDGWSADIFMSELRKLYIRYKGGLGELAPPDFQYRDFSAWQKNWLQGEKLESHLKFWRQHLGGELPILELPHDHPRPQQFGYTGKKYHSHIELSLIERLDQLAKRENVTLYMVLLASYFVFLNRHTNQNDIVVGTPIANRHHADTDKIIGYFANTLAIRTQLTDSDSFLQLLSNIRQTCVSAYQHQDMPFEQLVKSINPERAISHTAIYQTMFLYADGSLQLETFDDISTEKINISSGVAHTDLSFELTRLNERFEFALEYSTELFEETTAHYFAERFITLLEDISRRPETTISELSIIPPKERQQILNINQTHFSYDNTLKLDELLSRQSKLTPDKFAIDDGQQKLTYATLESEVTQLACYLADNFNLAHNELVGLCVQRSNRMLVSMLAILRAGLAYLPLDPAYPDDRIQFILGDANCQLLVTELAFKDRVDSFKGTICYLDTLSEAQQEEKDIHLPHSTLSSDQQLAYSIYTSGSTGKPKGVLVTHQNVINFLASMAKAPGLSAENKLLAVTTISFDIAVLELFLPLFVGAQIVLADTQTTGDASQLMQIIESEDIDVMQATPATWNLLLTAGWHNKTTMKILCGGEAMSQSLAQTLTEQGHQLWNMYGPTETTVWSSIKKIETRDDANLIGQPISNTQLYILNECHHLQPIGVKGEIYIGGDSVTRGYLNRNSLTRQRFINIDLNSTESGSNISQRLYRTGDVARLNANGDIEYIERIDNQIKLRGYRIELGEIENNIMQHPSIRQVACVVKQQNTDDVRIYAYFAKLEPTQDPDIKLREFLSARLPAYMLPQHFVELTEFPETPNGKVDKKALMTRDDGMKGKKSSSTTAIEISNTEAIIVEIWRECLMTENIDPHDNFFDLGGHSLLSIQVIEAIKRKTGVQITAQEILMNTLAQIALKCEVGQPRQAVKKSFWRRLFSRK